MGELAIRSFEDGEPRVMDLELAERLGFGRPRDIRQLIERNLAELERYGTLRRHTATPIGGGPEATEYWPNEQQALLVCVLSKTPRAADVREEVIRVFVAYRHGRTLPSLAGVVERIGSMFDEKLVPVHERMSRIEDNVVFLAVRMDDMAPRHDFTKETKEQWLMVIRSVHFNGFCPCCRKNRMLNDSGEKHDLHNDHFRGRERNNIDEGWPICAKCNVRLKNDPSFKEDKRAHFKVFHDIRKEMFGGHSPKLPRKRPRDPMLPGI